MSGLTDQDERHLEKLLGNVSCEVEVIKPEVGKFSHGLRAFRDFIHPTANRPSQVLGAGLAVVEGER